jgi:hypothetical protein
MRDGRTASSDSSGKIAQGILMAKVVGYLDPSFMCGLEVTLLRDQGNNVGEATQSYQVKYASPFYGSTAFENLGLNKADFNDTQKSYGMWFPTPEIGTTVLVVFVDGNPAEGYMIACIPGRFMNHMIPAIGGSTEYEITDADKKKYDTTQPLPVAEVNRKTNTLEKSLSIEKIKRPVHPIADRFLEQGLLEDDVRGVTTSTSRRDAPNTVFGISTPGPFDRRLGAKKQFIGDRQNLSPVTMPVSRLGGTTFVMDDGEDRYQRKTPAGQGPVEYADTLEGEKGDPNIPYNEYFRVRTRTGHQILLHNSEDLIYIGNARGTAWIELTSNGKIDIYSQDSISIHTENDLNIRADRDINFEAGRNVNLKAQNRLYQESVGDTKILIGANGSITTKSDLHIATSKSNYFSASAETHVNSGGSYFETAATINMNGATAKPATAELPIPTHDNPVTSSREKWEGKNRYQKKDPLKSIMKRVPMHEPWLLHENQAPNLLTPDNTDRET